MYAFVLQADLFIEDVLGRSLLHHGAQAGSVDVLSYLLQRQDEKHEGELQDRYNMKKYINKPSSGSGSITPLHYAAKVSLFIIYKHYTHNVGRAGNGDQTIIEIWCRYMCKR